MAVDTYERVNLVAVESLLESIPDLGLIFNDRGLIEGVNRATEQFFGYEPEQLIGAPISLLLPRADQYLNHSLAEHFLQNKENDRSKVRQQVTVVTKLGEEMVMDSYITVLQNENDLLFFTSLRPHAKASNDPIQSLTQDTLNAIFKDAAIGMMIVDLDQRPVDANPALQQMLQYSSSELRNMTFNEFTYKDDIEKGLSLFNDLKKGINDHYQLVKRYVRKDGQLLYGRVTVSLLCNPQGKPEHALSLIEDITERKLAQEELQKTHLELRKTHENLEKMVRERTTALTAANKNLIQQIDQRKQAEKELDKSQDRFSLVMQNTPIIIFALDKEGYFTYIEGKGLDLIGFEPENLVGKTMFELFSPNQGFHGTVSRAMKGESISCTVELNGYYFEIWCAPSRKKNNQIDGIVGVLADISERIHAQQKIKASERDLSTILNNMQDTFYRTDSSGKLSMVSPSVKSLLGFSAEEVLGRDMAEFYVEPTGREQFVTALKQNNGYLTGYEAPLRRKDGTIVWVSTNAHWRLDESGKLLGVEGITRDITKSKRTEQRLYYLANYDALTELPNRTLFRDRLKHAITLARRNSTKVALFFLDIDHFKNVNDSLGHNAGDQLLQSMAKRISSCAREGDTVARMGGDEFTVTLEGIHEPADAEHVAAKIIEAMSQPFQLEGHDINVSPSVGIALYPDDGQDIDELIKNADLAMYQAKEQGRNNYQFYRSDMKFMPIETLVLQKDLRDAINQDQLTMYYQPQLNLDTGVMTGMEALVRWEHPENGFLLPDEFIPVAEQTGLITSIDSWVITRVCKQLKEWKSAGLPTYKVAINLSSLLFQQRDFIDNVKSAIEEYDIDPTHLEFEITENILISDANQAIQTLEQLKTLGIRICIDDFGVGYSSLNYLKQFPLNTLKIDRSFIRDIETNENDADITEAIIALAHSLCLQVVAEGVENEEQLSYLVPNGCDLVQGFLFSSPCPADQITAWMTPAANAELRTSQ